MDWTYSNTASDFNEENFKKALSEMRERAEGKGKKVDWVTQLARVPYPYDIENGVEQAKI